MALRDAFAALRTLVLADSEIAALVSTRVYVNAIPESVIESQDPRAPSKMVVLRRAGGSPKADILPTENLAMTCLCYGESDREAMQVLLAVSDRLVYLDREIVDDVLFHHFNPTGGAIPLVDPDIVWPAVAQGFTFMADTKEL